MVVLWLEKKEEKNVNKVSMKLIASLSPARAEIEAGVVAKADQYSCLSSFLYRSSDRFCFFSSHLDLEIFSFWVCQGTFHLVLSENSTIMSNQIIVCFFSFPFPVLPLLTSSFPHEVFQVLKRRRKNHEKLVCGCARVVLRYV